MKTMHAHLRLSTSLSERNRDRCPEVAFSMDGTEIATIKTDMEFPHLPIDDGSIDELIVFDDALSRVIDEEAWLKECTRVVALGGRMRFTLPNSGMLAWLDAINIYRYIADISGRGDSPDAAQPTGWNRHYTREEVCRLVRNAGLDDPKVERRNYAMQEIRTLGGFLRNNWIRGDRKAERDMFPKLGSRDPGERSSIIATTWSVTAIKKR